MRIIAGKYRGRKLESFDVESTRPTLDRIKEPLFSILMPHLEGAKVLDLFSGTGNLGIEDGKHIAIVAHKAPQLALEVITENKNWEYVIEHDWRKTKSWQPGWDYTIDL